MTGDELRQWIRERGWSQAEAARELALSPQGLRHQIYGERPVSAQTARIVELLQRGARHTPPSH